MDKTRADHLLALFKAGVSAIPVVGGPIASLISDYVPFSTQKSLERASTLLEERIRELGNRIDPEAINKDEFSELFKSSYLAIVRTHQEEKLIAAVNLVANILLRSDDSERLTYTELDHFSRSIDSLSIGAIRVLAKLVETINPKSDERIFSNKLRVTFAYVQKQMPGTEPSLLMGLLGELNALNLLHLPGSPSVRTPDYDNYNVELTPIGIRFVRYLLRRKDKATSRMP